MKLKIELEVDYDALEKNGHDFTVYSQVACLHFALMSAKTDAARMINDGSITESEHVSNGKSFRYKISKITKEEQVERCSGMVCSVCGDNLSSRMSKVHRMCPSCFSVRERNA